MTRNIYLAYFLAAMKHSWFFLGIWVLYYLRFTDYAGIGIIETIGILTTTLTEIPTGAIADLLGKKKTLILSFIFETVGAIIWSTCQNFGQLVLSIFILFIGGALYSGTLDALIFDTLKQENREKDYDRVIANISTITLIVIALSSVIGGLLYPINFRLPFYPYVIANILGLIGCLFLTEPKIDTIKFSLNNYRKQIGQGFSQLFSRFNRQQVINLILLGGFVVILDEMMEAFLLVEFGFKAQAMGLIYSIIYVVSAFSSQLGPWLKRRLGLSLSILLIGLIVAISLIVSPFIGLAMGGLMVLLRYNLAPIFNNLSLIMINRHTESKYRATTISTFNMLKNLPYVLTAFFIGSLMDLISAQMFAFYFGLALLLILLIQKITLDKKISTR